MDWGTTIFSFVFDVFANLVLRVLNVPLEEWPQKRGLVQGGCLLVFILSIFVCAALTGGIHFR